MKGGPLSYLTIKKPSLPKWSPCPPVHARGLQAGLEAAIDSRLGKVQGAMFKAKAMIEDFKLQAIAGMEAAILQTLLSGCGGQIGASKRIYEKLDDIKNEYLWMIYSCPP